MRPRSPARLAVLWTAALLVACGEKPVGTDSDGGSSSGASASTGPGTTTTAGTETGVVTGGSTTTAGTTGGAGCGACAPDEYCNWPDGACGPPEAGECTPKPDGCGDIYMPVCGCDGAVYPNDCAAATAGIDITSVDKCAPPMGYFLCGTIWCDAQFSYCRRDASDVGGIPDTYSCQELPPGCAPPSCECLAGEPCGDLCEPIEGGFRVTCPGG